MKKHLIIGTIILLIASNVFVYHIGRWIGFLEGIWSASEVSDTVFKPTSKQIGINNPPSEDNITDITVTSTEAELPNTLREPNQVIQASVSAYNLEASQTDQTPCVGASGKNLCLLQQQGFSICACPSRFKFGSRFEIAGQIFTCEDRMGEKYQYDAFDLLMDTRQQALDWGRRWIDVRILE